MKQSQIKIIKEIQQAIGDHEESDKVEISVKVLKDIINVLINSSQILSEETRNDEVYTYFR